MEKIRIDNSQTVSEFIETLKMFPQDLPIRINYMKGTEILVSNEFFDGDSANPNCPIIRAVIVT
ncbi:MAG: hypothetical protein J6X14_00900 [Lachnospiraceae bacterium]|nr:hypothetical protein [Lachnospiraceae bacterium]